MLCRSIRINTRIEAVLANMTGCGLNGWWTPPLPRMPSVPPIILLIASAVSQVSWGLLDLWG